MVSSQLEHLHANAQIMLYNWGEQIHFRRGAPMSKFSVLSTKSLYLTAILLGVAFATSAAQESKTELLWPNFRGPDGNGTSSTAQPPTTWSASENVAWKQKIPGKGTSSPIVVGNRVFITAAAPADKNAPKELTPAELLKKFDANGDGRLNRNERQRARSSKPLLKQNFKVICYDRATGDPVWEKVATEALPFSGHHPDHGYASASPVTDGNFVYVNFGSYGLYCYDLQGNLKWKRDDLGKMTTRGNFGEGSSVAIHDGMLILPWDHEGQSRIEVINCNNGETIWKVNRDEPSAWATPLVVEVDGRKQIIHSGQNFSRGYDLRSGEEIWKASGMAQRPVASPVAFGETGYFGSARGGASLQAIPLTLKGDISQNGITWSNKREAPDVPSPVLSENRLFFLKASTNILACVNAETGDPFFSPQRLSIKGVYSSPVAANGNVYVTGREGVTVVISDAVTFDVVSTNDIGEPVDATLALVDEEIFIRGRDHLFCIRNK